LQNVIVLPCHRCYVTEYQYNYKKAELSQRWPRDAPYVWDGCPENFRESL